MAESNKQHCPLTDTQRRKNELIAELARARSGMTLHAGHVGYQADLSRRVKSSLRNHIRGWLAGALVTGGFISMLPARQKKVYINPLSKSGRGKVVQSGKASGGFFMSLVRALVPIFKPLLTAYITKQLATMVGGAKEAQKTAERTTQVAERTAEEAAKAT